MMGYIFSAVAGALMSLQGVFNTRASEKVGLWEINTIVQGVGFVVTFVIMLIVGNGNIRKIGEVNKLYLLGGVFGALIIYTVMMGMKALGPTCAVGTILVAQLLTAAAIDRFGLFESTVVPFHFTKIIGVVIMIIGIIIFKCKG